MQLAKAKNVSIDCRRILQFLSLASSWKVGKIWVNKPSKGQIELREEMFLRRVTLTSGASSFRRDKKIGTIRSSEAFFPAKGQSKKTDSAKADLANVFVSDVRDFNAGRSLPETSSAEMKGASSLT